MFYLHFLTISIILENKAKSRWDIVQSLGEAKYALKHLFDMIAESRRSVDAHKGIISIKYINLILL